VHAYKFVNLCWTHGGHHGCRHGFESRISTCFIQTTKINKIEDTVVKQSVGYVNRNDVEPRTGYSIYWKLLA
jgi:hypothetical protein